MSQRPGFIVALILVGCGLLIYDIGLRSSGPSITAGTVNRISTALKPIVASLERQSQRNECSLSTESPTFEQFYDYIEEEMPCDLMTMFGGRGHNPAADGAKAVCMDPSFAPRTEGCVVLSFGINNEWSFDDAMEQQGCTVYAFDPTMAKRDHTRGQRIHFYSLGLSEAEGSIQIGKKNVPVTSLRKILERFSLLDTDIDYLKIDIEGSEIGFFKNILAEDKQLLKRVKQIGMEIHNGRGNNGRKDVFWSDIHRLRCLGFRQVASAPNTAGQNSFSFGDRRVSSCYEIVWINEAYL